MQSQLAKRHFASLKLSRFLIFSIIISAVFLARFGLRITEEFSLPFSYIFLYFLIFTGINKDFLLTSNQRLLLFGVFFICASISYILGVSYQSSTSLMLILFIYFPVVFFFKNSKELIEPGLFFFRNCLFALGIAGILQYFIQYIYSPSWLFDYTPYFPSWILMGNAMNTAVPIGSHFKANGFFCREPSSFSQFMAIGILLELHVFRQWKRLPWLVLALLLSFSGTGLILLGIALLFPLNSSTLPRVLITGFVAALIFFTLGKPLGLDATLERASEFQGGVGVRTSSGFARFIAPAIVVCDGTSHPMNFFFGHGPGTMSRTITGFEFHDPTWSKLYFEYGAMGFLTLLIFFCVSLSNSYLPSPPIAGWVVQYFFLGGALLTFDTVVIPLVFISLLSKKQIGFSRFAKPTA
jgi:hypothetical protein